MGCWAQLMRCHMVLSGLVRPLNASLDSFFFLCLDGSDCFLLSGSSSDSFWSALFLLDGDDLRGRPWGIGGCLDLSDLFHDLSYDLFHPFAAPGWHRHALLFLPAACSPPAPATAAAAATTGGTGAP